MSRQKPKKLKIKKLHQDAVVPTQPDSGDAGYDLFALKETTITTGRVGKINTGIAIQIPDGYFAKIFDRSGFFTTFMGSTGAGVVDNGYRGEVIVCMMNSSNMPITIQKGQKFAQMVLLPIISFPVEETDSLDDSERGDAGFGSTGQ